MAELSYDAFVATLPRHIAKRGAVESPGREKWTKIPRRVLRPIKHRSSTAHLRLGEVSGHEWMAADPCVYCGGPARQWDHIEPLYRGGAHAGDNLARVCWACNSAKNTKKLVVFLARRAAKPGDPTNPASEATP